MKPENVDRQTWAARGLVMAYAVVAGAVVIGFSWLCDWAARGFAFAAGWQPLLPLLWTPLCTASIAWLTLHFVPGAAGSGIPQLMAALSPALSETHRSALVCLRLSMAKAVLTAAGLFAGLTLGREGPSVQIAAGVMQAARRWGPGRSTAIDPHTLLVAGGAAGVAAAFCAPLAGVVFALEQLSLRFRQQPTVLIIASAAIGGALAMAWSGRIHHFGPATLLELPLQHVPQVALLTVVCGGFGGMFARLLQTSLAGSTGRISHWRRRYPVRFAACCGLMVALLGLASGGVSFGSGEELTRQLLKGPAQATPVLDLAARCAATWLAVWSGVPGGVFTPSLAIGAGLGHDIATLMGLSLHVVPFVVLGMAAFLAAVTQSPLTACVIVVEMVHGYSMAGALLLVSLGASRISRAISAPLYATLAGMHVRQLRPQPQHELALER